MTKDNHKSLTVQIPTKIHEELKIAAIKQKKTIQKYLTELLEEKLFGGQHG